MYILRTVALVVGIHEIEFHILLNESLGLCLHTLDSRLAGVYKGFQVETPIAFNEFYIADIALSIICNPPMSLVNEF